MVEAIATRRRKLEENYTQWNEKRLHQQLDHAASQYGDRPYVITDAKNYSYDELAAWSRRIGAGLIKAGLKQGDHIALEMANYPEFIAVKYAISRIGAVCVPVNFMLREEELAYVLRQSDARALVTMDGFREYDYLAGLDKIAPGWRDGATENLPKLEHVFVRPTEDLGQKNYRSLSDLEGMGDADSESELARREKSGDAHALSDIIYTSGTTGRSKGVMLTHDMVLRAAYSSVYTRAFEDGRRILFALPIYHVFGYVECTVAVTFVGGAAIPHAKFDPLHMIEAAEQHKASEMVCVPMMTHQLLDIVKTRGFDSSSFICMFNSGGVNVPTVWQDIRDLLGAPEIVTAYGMTETTASTTCTLPEGDDKYLLESNGCFKPAHISAPKGEQFVAVYKSIDTATGEDLPAGKSGELVAKGAIVTKGYYNKPDETAEAFTADGWLRTGDIGAVNSEGYLRLTGRLKESYRCGGEMVMPREVEEIYDNHPDLETALVIGIPDMKMGEVGYLCIVEKDGHHADDEALLDMARDRLARFKIPHKVLRLNSADIPMTVTGRPQKVQLRQEIIDQIAAKETA